MLDTLPFGRTPQTAAVLTPGASAVSTFGAIEIGGMNIIMTGGELTNVHGSRGGDSRVTIEGLTTSGAEGEGAFANLLANKRFLRQPEPLSMSEPRGHDCARSDLTRCCRQSPRQPARHVVVRLDGADYESAARRRLAANQVVPNSAVRASLGRDLSGGAASVTVNLVAPGTMYGDRLNQLDLRFGKVVRIGQLRTVVSVDVYNALNANPVLTENAAYRDTSLGGWRIPTSILPARFVKFGVQVDF